MKERDKLKGKRGVRITAEYEVEVRDKDGKLLSKTGGMSDSFVKIFISMLRGAMSFDGGTTGGSATLTDTGGTSRSWLAGSGNKYICGGMGVNAAGNVDAFGVVIGTSDVAFDRTHVNLQGKIAHGVGAGQMVYGSDTVEAVTDEDSTTRFRVIRAFTNSSGAGITVKEIGMVVRYYNYTDVQQWNFLIARDVLAVPQTVPDGASLTVRYRIYISYA